LTEEATTAEEQEQTPPPYSERRRSPRVPVAFSVTIEGQKADGATFTAHAEAIKISTAGATLITDAPVEATMQVRITPPFGKSFEAEVNGVWINEEDGKQHCGVKLVNDTSWFAV
jgi:PilZ domain